MTTTTDRNAFHALLLTPDWALALIREAEAAGVYTAGIASNRQGRGESINVDLYGYDAAHHLAVLQVRQCRFRPGRFHKVRKNYFLLGRTEDGTVFAHPVDSPAHSRSALATPEATVAYVLSKIWDCAIADLPEIRRQGDVAFIPSALPDAARPLVVQTVTIRTTHVITADRLWFDPTTDTYYASKKARAVHTKGEHAPVRVRHGYFRIQPGLRARTWHFAAPYGD